MAERTTRQARRPSAGILLFRRSGSREIAVLLAHPGGPFWARRDLGAWTIPKGECAPDELPDDAARREFAEETGYSPDGVLVPLGEVVQPGGKRVIAFALEGAFDPERLVSNTFEIEWPPRSGKLRQYPEIDRAAWFAPVEARVKILPAQAVFLDRLIGVVKPRI